MNPDDLQVLAQTLSKMLAPVTVELNDKCIFACLAELYARVTAKLVFPAQKTTLRISMAQAAAFVHVYRTRIKVTELSPYAYSTLITLTDEMHRQII